MTEAVNSNKYQKEMLQCLQRTVRDPRILFPTKVTSTDSKIKKKKIIHILTKFTTHTNLLKELKDISLKKKEPEMEAELRNDF